MGHLHGEAISPDAFCGSNLLTTEADAPAEGFKRVDVAHELEPLRTLRMQKRIQFKRLLSHLGCYDLTEVTHAKAVTPAVCLGEGGLHGLVEAVAGGLNVVYRDFLVVTQTSAHRGAPRHEHVLGALSR